MNENERDCRKRSFRGRGESGNIALRNCNEALEQLKAENRRLRQRVAQLSAFKRLAFIDELTGLYNRRCFKRRLVEESSRAKRHDTPLGLLVADVDDLKTINDRAGHPAGDSVLSWVGTVLAKTCRQYDVPCRIGGDEFAVILPETDQQGIEAVIKRLAKYQFEARDQVDVSPDLPVGLSFGFAVMQDGSIDAEQLFCRADAAMYANKRLRKTGRPPSPAN